MAVTQPMAAANGTADVEDRFRELVTAWKAGRAPVRSSPILSAIQRIRE